MQDTLSATRDSIGRRTLLLVAIATVAATGLVQAIEHSIFMNLMELSMFWYHVASGVVDALTVCAIVTLYLTVRRDGRQLRSAFQRLRASETLRQDLVSMVVHDLKNPLASALGALQVARSGCQSEREREMIDLAMQAQQRLDGMIGDLLAISRAEEGQLTLQTTPVDLADIARDCIGGFSMPAQRQGVQIVADLQPAAGVLDQPKITRVIDNLLSNAVKFTPSGGVVTVHTSRDDGKLRLSVADTREGIPSENRERIFDKFGQLELRQTLGVSVGLGLAFCRYAVEAHQGRIWVEDRPGGGSVFSVELPQNDG